MCSEKGTFEYTFDGVRVNALCWFDMYVGNGFFTVHFEFIFVVNDVSININDDDIQEIQRFISVFIFYGVLDGWILFCLEFLENCLLDVLMDSVHDCRLHFV